MIYDRMGGYSFIIRFVEIRDGKKKRLLYMICDTGGHPYNIGSTLSTFLTTTKAIHNRFAQLAVVFVATMKKRSPAMFKRIYFTPIYEDIDQDQDYEEFEYTVTHDLNKIKISFSQWKKPIAEDLTVDEFNKHCGFDHYFVYSIPGDDLL